MKLSLVSNMWLKSLMIFSGWYLNYKHNASNSFDWVAGLGFVFLAFQLVLSSSFLFINDSSLYKVLDVMYKGCYLGSSMLLIFISMPNAASTIIGHILNITLIIIGAFTKYSEIENTEVIKRSYVNDTEMEECEKFCIANKV